ncbi:MAG TPA: MerR family transcriptional regulator [Acidimicrobiales bacterium]|jgi:DNA-binding transcriptional MerR regulator|nr:MerR family transcriptional regulator [Acidimicrobiales bacterium]
MRVEQLSARAGVSVDTIRYYQSKGLLDPPRREGRLAWYGESHQARLERIRTLQQEGFTLATIARLVSGDLDAADEALLAELSGIHDPRSGNRKAHEPGQTAPGSGEADDDALTLDQLAVATGVPLEVLKAVEAEGLLIPRRIGRDERYTQEDVAAARAGLLLLDWGIPLSALLDLARRHHQATEATALEAVAMFSAYVREPLRRGRSPKSGGAAAAGGEPDVEGLLHAYAELLPAVNALVGHHFTRTLVKTALDHVERVGSPAERRAVHDRIGADADLDPTGPEQTDRAVLG